MRNSWSICCGSIVAVNLSSWARSFKQLSPCRRVQQFIIAQHNGKLCVCELKCVSTLHYISLRRARNITHLTKELCMLMENMFEKCVCIFSTRLSSATMHAYKQNQYTYKRNALKSRSLHWAVQNLLFSLPTLSIFECLCWCSLQWWKASPLVIMLNTCWQSMGTDVSVQHPHHRIFRMQLIPNGSESTRYAPYFYLSLR